jgi:hypothetical protein
MASMQSFESIMMTKEDYEEQGLVLIDKKCFEWFHIHLFKSKFLNYLFNYHWLSGYVGIGLNIIFSFDKLSVY